MLTVMDHPLIRAKLTRLRDKSTDRLYPGLGDAGDRLFGT